jgi:hypothetical protein
MMLMTLSWGVVLVTESVACGALAFALSIKSYFIVSPIIRSATLGAMTAWSYWYARRRIGPLRLEAEREACTSAAESSVDAEMSLGSHTRNSNV